MAEKLNFHSELEFDGFELEFALFQVKTMVEIVNNTFAFK
jgi:hypothetical protein